MLYNLVLVIDPLVHSGRIYSPSHFRKLLKTESNLSFSRTTVTNVITKLKYSHPPQYNTAALRTGAKTAVLENGSHIEYYINITKKKYIQDLKITFLRPWGPSEPAPTQHSLQRKTAMKTCEENLQRKFARKACDKSL